MHNDVLQLVFERCSPFSKLCMSLTSKKLYQKRPLLTFGVSGAMTISDITILSASSSTIAFSCESIYGQDSAARDHLCLIDDYVRQRKVKPTSFVKPETTDVFIGKLSDSLPFPRDFKRETCFREIIIYLSWVNRRNCCRVDVKIRHMTPISVLAKQLWSIDKPDWLSEYCDAPQLFRSYSKFIEYKYLQHVVGIVEAERHLAKFILFAWSTSSGTP